MLEAGEGVVDITPPLGIELAGFHRAVGKERVITGIRQPSSARALVLRVKTTEVAIVSLDICALPRDFVTRVQNHAVRLIGIPPENIRLCATHTHSMPTLRFFRQWGAVPDEYSRWVEQRVIQAIALAQKDLAQADCYLGRERVTGGNHNRTTKTWKTDEAFDRASTDRDRWLDTTLHVLYFQREPPKANLAWYHFSAHPVCYTDANAGPDWPGLVVEKMRAGDGLAPSFLQGHCGDVNPGNGETSLGDPEKVSEAVYTALHHATNHSDFVKANELKLISRNVALPLDIERLKDQLARYRLDPAQCTKGEWVDERFARDWFEGASKWNPRRTSYDAPITALRLGDVALLFHPGELYSFYGLALRRASPFRHTLVVGYADDLVGYLTDPAAYRAGEYAALVVPKIMDLPPFKPEAAGKLVAAGAALLKKLA